MVLKHKEYTIEEREDCYFVSKIFSPGRFDEFECECVADAKRMIGSRTFGDIVGDHYRTIFDNMKEAGKDFMALMTASYKRYVAKEYKGALVLASQARMVSSKASDEVKRYLESLIGHLERMA